MSDEEEWVPGTMSELLSSIEHEWKALMHVIERLDDTRMTTPDEGGWTPKDNLAHLTEWLNILMHHHMDRRPRHEVLGVTEAESKDWDFNTINQVLLERNRDRSAQIVLADLKRAYAELLAKLKSLTFEYLLMPRHADDPEKRPLLMWVMGDTSWHFAEHRKTIEKLL
jgi:hypothetical protein